VLVSSADHNQHHLDGRSQMLGCSPKMEQIVLGPRGGCRRVRGGVEWASRGIRVMEVVSPDLVSFFPSLKPLLAS
jgi:hypothetical protein